MLTFPKVESIIWLQQKLRCLVYDIYVNMGYILELECGQNSGVGVVFKAPKPNHIGAFNAPLN